MPLVFLDEVERISESSRFWSTRHLAPVWFRRRDYLGSPSVDLDVAVRDLVEARTGARPGGRIALLSNVRTFGWLFNPISCYFCFEPAAGEVVALVAEVENTPWHDRHAYVVGSPGTYRFPKVLHVSPFLPMDLDYELTFVAPGEDLHVTFDLFRGEDQVLAASIALRRRPLDTRGIRRLVCNYPAMTLRVSLGIYRQAATLWRLGAPFFPHPRRSAQQDLERSSK